MFDNLSFYLNRDDVANQNFLECILADGDDIIVEKLGETGKGVPFGYISIKGKNEQKLTFKVLPHQVSLMGKNSSICKYYLGNNFETLSLTQFNEAIKEISNRLGVDLSKATVCRIDIATNFEMKYIPSSYHSCLIYLPRYARGFTNGNLYFKTTRKVLNFYDKKKEYKQKGVKIPEKFINIQNVLRYEIRFKKNVAITLKQKVTVADLCNQSFFLKIVELWKNHYWNITKQNPIVFNQTSTLKTSDFKDYYFVKGIDATGGIEYVYSSIDESKKNGTISNSQACYLKKIVNNSFKSSSSLPEYDFVYELDEKMKTFVPIL